MNLHAKKQDRAEVNDEIQSGEREDEEAEQKEQGCGEGGKEARKEWQQKGVGRQVDG